MLLQGPRRRQFLMGEVPLYIVSNQTCVFKARVKDFPLLCIYSPPTKFLGPYCSKYRRVVKTPLHPPKIHFWWLVQGTDTFRVHPHLPPAPVWNMPVSL